MTSFQGYSSSGQSGNRWQPLPIIASRDPIDNFDLADPSGGSYQIDQEWFNNNGSKFWKYAGQGQWVLIAAKNGDVISLSDDNNVQVYPDAGGNIQFVGHVNEQVGKFSTVTNGTNLLNINPMSTARWIVDPLGFNGTHTTISSAITSATSGDTIFLLPGTYTENLTLKAGVNITAYMGDAITPNVTIIGKLTMTTAGTVTVTGIRLQTNSDFFLAVTGSAASNVNLYYCYLNCINNTGISFTSSGSPTLNIYYCNGDIGTTGISLYNASANGLFLLRQGRYTNSGNSSTASTNSSATVSASFCEMNFPISTSGTGAFAANHCAIDTSPTNTSCLTTAGTGACSLKYSRFTSGTASSLSVGAGTTVTATLCDIASSNTNAITGAGTLVYDSLVFSSSSSVINTTTQTVNLMGPRLALGGGGCQIISGSGSPNGVITAPKGSLWLRTDGTGVNDRAFINTDAGTTWTAIVTVA